MSSKEQERAKREEMHRKVMEQFKDDPEKLAEMMKHIKSAEFFKDDKWRAVPIFEELMEYPFEDVLELYNMKNKAPFDAAPAEKEAYLERYRQKIASMKKKAGAPEKILLWPAGKMPEKTDYTDNSDHEHVHNPGFIPHMYEVLVPEYVTPKGAVICIAGGEQDENVLPEGVGSAIELRSKGYQCFVLQNRVNGTWDPEDVGADVARAIRYIRANAAKYRIPDNRVAVAGFSNGGLTGEVNIQYYAGDKDLTDYYPDYVPDALDAFRGYPDAYICVYGPRFDGSPFNYEGIHYPPTMIVAGREDFAATPNLKWMFDDLTAHGIPTEVHNFAGAPHGCAGLALVNGGKDPYPNFGLWTTLADVFMQDAYARA